MIDFYGSCLALDWRLPLSSSKFMIWPLRHEQKILFVSSMIEVLNGTLECRASWHTSQACCRTSEWLLCFVRALSKQQPFRTRLWLVVALLCQTILCTAAAVQFRPSGRTSHRIVLAGMLFIFSEFLPLAFEFTSRPKVLVLTVLEWLQFSLSRMQATSLMWSTSFPY